MSNFWKNKKVLVTGGAGFIGSHLVERLITHEAKVIMSVRNLKKTHFLQKIKTKIKIVKADLLDFKTCLSLTKNIDIVMNLAADVGGIQYNMEHQASTFRNNVQIFLNIAVTFNF